MMAQQKSIQRKITLALFGATVIVLLISILTFAVYDLSAHRTELTRSLSVLGDVLADNTTGSLKFENAGDATDVLASMRFEPAIQAAAVYDQEGQLFATYPPANTNVPPLPGEIGFQTTFHSIELFRPIVLANERIGTFYLRSSLEALYQRFMLYSLLTLLIVLGSLMATLLFSRRMERQISRPILSLANVARAISEKRDFSVRAKKSSEDELGLLTDAFNQMLTRIEEQTAALEESDERLRLSLQAGNTGTWDWNIKSAVVNWDAQNHRLFGLEPGAFQGSYEHFLLLIHPDDRQSISSQVLTALEQKTDYVAEFRVIWKDGSVHNLITRGKAIYDENGNPTRMSGVTADITERKKSEEARSLLAAVVESTDDAIVGKALDGTILSWNRGAEKLFGYTAQEAIGQPITIILPPDRIKEERDIRERICHGGPAEHHETIRCRKSGDPVEVAITVSAIRDDNGHIVGSSVTFRDITVQKRTGEALQEQARLLDLSFDAIIVRAKHNRVTYWNRGAEELYGWTKDEAMGKDAHRLLKTEFPEDIAIIEGQLLRDTRWEGEVIHTCKDGTRRTMLARWALDRDSEGNPGSVLETNTDITVRKDVEKKLRDMNFQLESRVNERTAELSAANRELEAFTYSVAHDLRAPLRHINAFAKILEEDFASQLNPEIREYLGRIRGSSQNLSQLVDDLLNLARVGRQELTYQYADPYMLIQQARDDLNLDVQNRNIEWRIQENLPMIHCDPGLMKLVFVNLLSNAIKYTRPRPKALIEIGSTNTDGLLTFFIRDNGVGFNMQYGNKLFGVFQRLHRQEEFEGTGVGLATVDRIIRKHGGRIWAESETGKGATFYFTVSGTDRPTRRKAVLTPEHV